VAIASTRSASRSIDRRQLLGVQRGLTGHPELSARRRFALQARFVGLEVGMSATPIPADPAPSMTMRWSRGREPVALTAPASAPTTTAAVPWISSLNVSRRSR